jgi:hypothetical protein
VRLGYRLFRTRRTIVADDLAMRVADDLGITVGVVASVLLY